MTSVTMTPADSTSAGVESPADPQIDRLLALARTHLGMEVAWLSTFTTDQQVITSASGDTSAMNVVVDEGTDLAGSFCARVVLGTLPPVITDARRHPITRELAVTRDLNIGSYVGAPWRDADGNVAGMLCCLSRTAHPELDDTAVRYLNLLTDLISDHLGSPAARAHLEANRSQAVIRDVLRTSDMRTVVQPVVRIADGEIVAVEALSRFDPDLFATPDRAFSAANECGLGLELELFAAAQALSLRDSLPDGIWLGLNLSAEAAADPRAHELLMHYAGREVGVEITEHTPIADYEALNNRLRPLRAAGFHIIVDDAGAGFASLSHILQLRPDTIKLDIALVRGIDSDPVRRALTRSLVSFAAETGAALLAEGVETAAERDTLQELGVTYGQGYLWGRPAPKRSWPELEQPSGQGRKR